MEARLDVLLTVWNCLILFNVTLEDDREKGECRTDTGEKAESWECDLFGGKGLTFRRIMSISEYFIPFTRIGISLKKKTQTTTLLLR